MKDLIHRFTPDEVAALKRRQDAVFALVATIAEIHNLPGGLSIEHDNSGPIGLYVHQQESPTVNPLPTGDGRSPLAAAHPPSRSISPR